MVDCGGFHVFSFGRFAPTRRRGFFRGAAALCFAFLTLPACTTATPPQITSMSSGPAGSASSGTMASAQPVADMMQPAKAADLRLVLRSTAEIDGAKQSTASIVAQPLTGDLWQALVVDSATNYRFATAADLDQLKLSQSDAFLLGLRNATAALPALATVTHDLTPHQIGVIQGQGEETSRLLSATDWAPLARELGGHLLVAVPAHDTVLYCEENGTQSVRTFAAITRDTAAKAEHAVSRTLLRWTPAGWQGVTVP